jgi:hypothetical protein
MTPEQFAYWLQGFAEINGKVPNEEEWQIIKDHLATVFTKITPDYMPQIDFPKGEAKPWWETQPTCVSDSVKLKDDVAC